MTGEQAKAILEAHDGKPIADGDRVLPGLLILSKHRSDSFYGFEHDQMYTADFEETVKTMTEDEIIEMARLNWFESDDYWSHC